MLRTLCKVMSVIVVSSVLKAVNQSNHMNPIFKEYKSLVAKVAKEKQFNKKVELNGQLNHFIKKNALEVIGDSVFQFSKLIGVMTPKVEKGHRLSYNPNK